MASAARPGTPSDAILGVQPRVVYEPDGVEAAAEVLALTARERMRVAFVGGGTELSLGAPPRTLDAVVRTRGLSRIVEYAPADMVLIAEGGATLAQIQAVAREHGQQLGIDAPQPERATIGGIVAANSFGPRRARYGAVRDLIIGVTLVRSDGAIARSGGKVVKNVAGFDLPKVACGSLGTLGLVARANFRLHPSPEASRTLLFEQLVAEQMASVVAKIRAAQLEPVSAVALRRGGHYELGIRFEGFGAGVAQQSERLLQLAHRERLPCEPLADEPAQVFWARHDEVRMAGSLRVKISALPSHFAKVDGLLAPLFGALRDARFAWYATLGLGFVCGVPEPAAGAQALLSARAGLVADQGSLVLHDASPEIRASVDVWGPLPPSFALMERLKERFDPDHRLNPGRFAGGI